MPGLDPISLGMTAAGLALNTINYFDADSAQNRAQRSLDQLSAQPWERYSVNPYIGRSYQTATNMASNPYGFTGAERGAFNQNLSRVINTQNQNATNISGGNMGKALNLLDVSGRVGALNDFASRDAQLRRSMQNDALSRQFQGASIYQNIDNMNIQNQLQRRIMSLQNYGRAVQSNRDYKRNLLGNMGNDLLGGGLMLASSGKGKTSTNPSVSSNYLTEDFII